MYYVFLSDLNVPLGFAFLGVKMINKSLGKEKVAETKWLVRLQTPD